MTIISLAILDVAYVYYFNDHNTREKTLKKNRQNAKSFMQGLFGACHPTRKELSKWKEAKQCAYAA